MNAKDVESNIAHVSEIAACSSQRCEHSVILTDKEECVCVLEYPLKLTPVIQTQEASLR